MLFKVNGWIQDAPDSRDLLFAANQGLFSASSGDGEHIIKEFTPISNQGALSSCVANAGCDAFEILMGLSNPNKVVQLSRLFGYWNARLAHKATDKDEGTQIRHFFYSLQSLGVCPEDVWPYDPKMVFAQPNIKAYKRANDNKITGYYRIDATGDERLRQIEAAVRANHPVVFGTAVSGEFVAYGGGGHTHYAPNAADVIGRHAMIVTGVRKSGSAPEFLLRNSWGTSWGDDGHCWVAGSYLTDSRTRDLWVPTASHSIV